MGADSKGGPDMQGWLRKPGKFVKVRRYFQVKGTTLSSFKNEGEPASWSVDIADSIVTGVGQLDIIIEVPDQRVLQLQAEDAAAHSNWMECLQQAASRKIDSFYSVGRELGQGPFSKVVLATHKKSCKQYAIKSVDKRCHLINYSESEVKAMRMVDHPNLVKTIDFFDTRNEVYIISEYLKGGLLYESVAKQEFVTEQTTSLVMRELLKAVNYLHRDGFCHRNIKPNNLICANAMFPQSLKLADFGFVNFMEKACEHDEYFDVTGTRAIITAPHFTAPEILYGKQGFGKAVDIWSCGVVLYTLLSGKLPFPGKNKGEVSEAMQGGKGKLDLPDAEWRTVSDDAKDLVKKMLAFDSSKRITAEMALAHPWVASDDKDNKVILADLKVLQDIPGMVWEHSMPSRLYSIESSASQASEGTFVISSETHKKMGAQKTKMMYGGGTGVRKGPPVESFDSDAGVNSHNSAPKLQRGMSNPPGKTSVDSDEKKQVRQSRGLGKSSRGMSRLSKGLKKNTTFAIFSRDKKEEPSEYW